jgi:aspartate aminotransferase-like enzyme/GNAT superfamily N-acetyltransferase
MSASAQAVLFKLAADPDEIEQIHRLNYRTFVEEIPQHSPNPEGRLVDRFHAENTYAIGVVEGRVVAMLALRGNRPFSLDAKLPDLDNHLPPGRRVIELRLLAVDPERRRGTVFHQLLAFATEWCLAHGYDMAVISGTTRQIKLYRHVGFEPFGPLVGNPGAQFQPMYLTLEAFVDRARRGRSLQRFARVRHVHEPINFLPGPVAMTRTVRAAFARPPESHRGRSFQDDFLALRVRLARFVNAERVQIILGSGSLGTDCMCAQLSLLGGRGVILSSGEFGERLAKHASRFGLDFAQVKRDWGHVFTRTELEAELDREPDTRWLLATHHETSSGVLNDLGMLRTVCAPRGIRLCVDCISSIGSVPVDLTGVWLATGASGKGLGAYPGLALVFHGELITATESRVPRYLDLTNWDSAGGIPFTHSSNLVRALEAAVAEADSGGTARFRKIAALASELRAGLRRLGFTLVAPDEHACPAIVTIKMNEPGAAAHLGGQLEEAGFILSYRSRYLMDRNWIQVSLMGAVTDADVAALLDVLARKAGSGPALLFAGNEGNLASR